MSLTFSEYFNFVSKFFFILFISLTFHKYFQQGHKQSIIIFFSQLSFSPIPFFFFFFLYSLLYYSSTITMHVLLLATQSPLPSSIPHHHQNIPCVFLSVGLLAAVPHSKDRWSYSGFVQMSKRQWLGVETITSLVAVVDLLGGSGFFMRWRHKQVFRLGFCAFFVWMSRLSFVLCCSCDL